MILSNYESALENIRVVENNNDLEYEFNIQYFVMVIYILVIIVEVIKDYLRPPQLMIQ